VKEPLATDFFGDPVYDRRQADLIEAARQKARERINEKGTKMSTETRVREPDMYNQHSERSFFADMYNAQVKGDPEARENIATHQRYELQKGDRAGDDTEQRATTSTTMGGLIPPAYLLELYAKAPRNGRVYADHCNSNTLPDTGMSVILPRITTATAAGMQATENTTVTTQDPAETDLTVPVRTLAGYLPVSRQALERSAYNDRILFEDLIARLWALLDTQCLSGGGGSGTIKGVLATSGTAASTASTATIAGVWPKIADVIQQVNTNIGGLGYSPDAIFMHPRRWGWFAAAVDSQGRPLVSPTAGNGTNTIAQGDSGGYGRVGTLQGLDVYTDASIPTTLGASTTEDRIIVHASPLVHLFERAQDPTTLSIDQQAGSALQVNLVAYSYAAYTCERYVGASGIVSGPALVPPTF
jgi:HK97 family phage major capsid protein